MRPAPVLAAFATLAAAGALACLDPQDRRPGLRLTGPVVEAPVADWSFSDAHPEIFLEVRTPYLLRHSVTIVCAQEAGQLYVGARNPSDKRWVSWVGDDPEVRLEIGGSLYPVRLSPIGGEAEHETVARAFARKYGRELPPREERPPMLYFRVLPSARSG